MLLKSIRIEGKTYEVRKISIGDEIKVQIFDQKTAKPVGVTYSANSETINDAHHYGEDIVEKLALIAEYDFKKRY
jgi:hypothetical protein